MCVQSPSKWLAVKLPVENLPIFVVAERKKKLKDAEGSPKKNGGG